jgi:signal transduction histidine kinase/FixJ family two-component response regulator
MPSLTALAPRLLRRARADQIETLFTQWPVATGSMMLGATILMTVMWGTVAPRLFAAWMAAIVLNQAWRLWLVRRYRAAGPGPADRLRWGRAWAIGSMLAGALWGVAGVALFVPGDPGHQALLIVCLFGVILGGINLTAVYRPSLYGFVLPALVPLIARVAIEGDQLHAFIAAVMLVVLAFILGFGHNLNNVLTQSLAIRYENVDLIGELQAQTAAADHARATAEEANRGKTQFLAAASHDLRQPLHALGLFVSALAAKVREPELKSVVGNINASVDALERLFSAMMDISKLDAGAVEPVRCAFPLAPLFQRVDAAFAAVAAARRLRLSVVATRAWVNSDPLLLERILFNLMSNAMRYTERGGAVLGVRRRGDSLALEVCDSGIGISAAEREHIFDEFYQVDATGRHGRQGMGLGLAIIRRLAALLGHPVEVDSRSGRGSRFSIVVPRATPRAAQLLSPDVVASGATFDGALIAVIDDESTVVEGMRAWLAQSGAVVVSAGSGEEMLTALGEYGRYPDLIVADYRLGGGALGTDAVALLRHELGLHIPAMLISGDSSTEAISAMRASSLHVLLKPVLPQELHLLVERLLAHGGEATALAANGSTPLKKSASERGAGGQIGFGMTG